MSTNKSLVKSGGIVAAGILSSRFLGFLRDVVLANLLGTGPIAEAFLVAQRIPNLLRDLVGEGAANAAIVPVLTEYKEQRTKEEWLRLINVVMAWSVIILGFMTILGMIFTPAIVRVIAPGFMSDNVKYELTINLTRIMFPYLILIALTAIQTGILYSLRSFVTPSFGPCLLNVAMILGAWGCASFSWPLAYGLAISVVIGGVLQFWLQYEALKKQGVVWKTTRRLNHAGAMQVGKLMVPRVWGSAVYQLNVFVDTFCASLATVVGGGGIAAIYFANRIIQLPLGVFGYALSSVSLPVLSASAARRDTKQFRETLTFVLRNLLFVLIPCAVFIAMTSPLLVRLIFQHGVFDANSTTITSDALFFFVLGLPFFGLTRILVAAFYALQDTRTPVKAATFCLVLNIFGNIMLMYPMKISGIALASSISGTCNVLLLIKKLDERSAGIRKEFIQFIYAMVPSTVVMGVVIWVLDLLIKAPDFIKLLIIFIVSGTAFIGMSIFTKMNEAAYILGLVKSKFTKQ